MRVDYRQDAIKTTMEIIRLATILRGVLERREDERLFYDSPSSPYLLRGAVDSLDKILDNWWLELPEVTKATRRGVMATTTAIQWDNELTTGFHDEDGVEPHRHFGILTIRDGKVEDTDWGFHRDEVEWAMEWADAHQEDCGSRRCPCYARGVEKATAPEED